MKRAAFSLESWIRVVVEPSQPTWFYDPRWSVLMGLLHDANANGAGVFCPDEMRKRVRVSKEEMRAALKFLVSSRLLFTSTEPRKGLLYVYRLSPTPPPKWVSQPKPGHGRSRAPKGDQ